MDALIDPYGNVTSVKVISGPPLLHRAAANALRQWKYEPARLDGQPVAVHLAVTLNFHLASWRLRRQRSSVVRTILRQGPVRSLLLQQLESGEAQEASAEQKHTAGLRNWRGTKSCH